MPASPPRSNSSAVEDYLERILELINTKGYARVVDIATSLKISQASVTNMVQRLDAEACLSTKNIADSSSPRPAKSSRATLPDRHNF